MKREIIEAESIDSLEEILAFDNGIRIFYHWMCRPQIKAALSLLDKKSREREMITILDVGCGTARILIGIVKKAPQCKFYGVDISANMLKVAAQNIEREGLGNKIELLHLDARSLPFKEKYFDIVMCSDMLHHLLDPIPLLKEMKRVVKDDGNILIRDVLRPPSTFMLNLYVNIFSLPYNKVMKKGYRESLYNAFTVEEFGEMLSLAGIEDSEISVSFPHFITIIKEL